jgi:hypothetical protein
MFGEEFLVGGLDFRATFEDLARSADQLTVRGPKLGDRRGEPVRRSKVGCKSWRILNGKPAENDLPVQPGRVTALDRIRAFLAAARESLRL